MEKLSIIRTLAELADLEEYIKDKDILAFDSETTGVSKESIVIGFSVCANTEEAFYVILSYWDTATKKLVDLETKTKTKQFMEALKRKPLIMQNAVFDCWMVNNNFQVDLMPALHTDTLMLGHLLNENRHNGLKERGVELFGEDARDEQKAMKESVHNNGGMLTKQNYQLYKADADLMARYGAKDAILTMKVFLHDIEKLNESGLFDFFYRDESMPLLQGPTYDMNTEGLRVDPDRLETLKKTLEADCLEAKNFIYQEITPHVADRYPGTGKTNAFNIGAGQQLSWLLYEKLGNPFSLLTDSGRELCKAIGSKLPYTFKDKKALADYCRTNKGQIYIHEHFDTKKKKLIRAKKIGDPWKYMSTDAEALACLADKYKWVKRLLQYQKNVKMLATVVGIQERMRSNIIRPSFLQHGTTSGRYSSKNPNFQNLPRDDKRIKACIVSRPGKVFVGADYSQLEPRVFASLSGDERLQASFANGDDFYSVIGTEVFHKTDCSLKKSDKNSFAAKYPALRDQTKAVALSATYGRTAAYMATAMGVKREEAQEIIDNYFEQFPQVLKLVEQSHEQAKSTGEVQNLFGRPRRIPAAKNISKVCGSTVHKDLPYEYRNLLNLSINHRIQSTGASIMNRAAIACWNLFREANIEAKIVLQVHDSLIVECLEQDADSVAEIVKFCMEKTIIIPGVELEAEPKIGKDLSQV